MDKNSKPAKNRPIARALHRWLGLAGLVWFAVMAVSGVLLNHHDLLAPLDVPRAWLPGDYEYRNWNRASLRGVESWDGAGLLFGEPGVWRVEGSGGPEPFSQGLPSDYYYKDTRDLLAVGQWGVVLAATRGGLFAKRADSPWEPVPLGVEREMVVELVLTDSAVLALTRSDIYAAPLERPLEFEWATPGRTPEPGRGESLFRLIFEMHSGETWGLPGRLVVDASGVLLTFFCITGGWFWWRKKRGTLARGKAGKAARKGLKLHIKLGLWASPLIIFVTLTGIFQRPPLLVAIAEVEYPQWMRPAPDQPNPWHDKFRKALFDPQRGTLVIATADGVYEGRAENPKTSVFSKVEGVPPISVMGATAFTIEGDDYIVGSMTGLYRWQRGGGVADYFTGETPKELTGPPVGEHLVAGYLGRQRGWTDYNRGLASGAIPMPAELADGGRISLWHALFEVHNGRIFTFLLGWWAWVAVPLVGLMLLAEAVTGVLRRLR